MDEAHVLLVGRSRTIAFAVIDSNGMPARDFLGSEELPDKDLSSLKHAMQVLADEGMLNNREKFKKLRGELWEFKSYQARLACFWDPNHKGVLRLASGFIKKKDDWPESEVERALTIMNRHNALQESVAKPAARGKSNQKRRKGRKR